MSRDSLRTPCRRRPDRRLRVVFLTLFLAALALAVSSCSRAESEAPVAVPEDTESTKTTTTSTTAPPFVVPTIDVPARVGSPELGSAWVAVNEPGVGGRLTGLVISPVDSDHMLAAGDLLGVSITTDGGATWETTTGFQNWEVGHLSFDPGNVGRVWASTMGGPHLSTDGGRTWELKRAGMPDPENTYTSPIEDVLFDPNVEGRLLAVGGSQRRWASTGSPAYGAIWESLDNGESWAKIGTVDGQQNVQAAAFLASSSDDLLVALEGAGIQRSVDGGRTWIDASEGLPHTNTTDLAVHPFDPLVAWATLGAGPKVGENHIPGGVYVTKDGGVSWRLSGEGLTAFAWTDEFLTSRFEAIEVSPLDPDRLYTADVSYRENIIFRSDDGGSTWQAMIDEELPVIDAYSSYLAAREIAIDPQDPDTIIFAQDEFMMISRDGAETAVDLTTDLTVDGTLIGRGFSGLVATDVVFNPLQEGDVTLLGFDGGNFIQSLDGLTTYRRTLRGDDDWGGAERAVYAGPAGAQRLYLLLGQADVFRGIGVSIDGGETFTVHKSDTSGLPATGYGTGLAVDPDDPDHVFVVVDGRLFRSTDGAQTFLESGRADTFHDVVIMPATGRLYLSGENVMWSSDDNGETLEPVLGTPRNSRRLTIDPHQPTEVYVTSHDLAFGGVHRFDGETWARVLDVIEPQHVAVHPTQPDSLVVVTQDLPHRDVSRATGVWVSTDRGVTWRQANEALPMLRVSAVAFDPHLPDRVVIGTYGRGFLQASFSAITEGGDAESRPGVFAAATTTPDEPELAVDGNADTTAPEAATE